MRESTNDSEEATTADQFVGTEMDQYGTIWSTIKRHNPTSYKADFSNKPYKKGTLDLNVYDSYTMVLSKEETMMHILGVAMIQTFSPKNVLKKFSTWGENLATEDLNQLHGMETYFTLDSKTLTKDNQEETLV